MDKENEPFEMLQKLLALKKHEQPPPGYFHSFSSKVIARLHALEASRAPTWRQRLGLDFDFKPAVMGASGVLVCGLLLVGVIASHGLSQTSSPNITVVGDPSAFFPPSAGQALASGMALTPTLRPEEIPASTVPVSDTANSPFAQLTPRSQRVGFVFPPGN